MNRPHFVIDEPAYRAMLSGLSCMHHVDRAGVAWDSAFLYEDTWLVDTAVSERLVRRRGQIQVHLVFAYSQNPFRFLSRHITTCYDSHRARVVGQLMRRQAAKDQRGTITLSEQQWNLPPN